MTILEVVSEIVGSSSQARRLFKQNGVKCLHGYLVEEKIHRGYLLCKPEDEICVTDVYKIGKRRFFEITMDGVDYREHNIPNNWIATSC